MATKAGELFINIGIKGADKTISAFANVRSSVDGVTKTSWEAKVALLGAMYALQQFASAAGMNAQGLTNLNATLGVSVDTLQRLEYVATKFGAAKGAMGGALGSLSSLAAEAKMSGNLPAAFSLIAGTIHDPKFLDDLQNRRFDEVLKGVQKFANSGIPKDLILSSLQGIGLGGIAPQLMRGKFTEKELNKAPVDSKNMIAGLDRMQEVFKDVEARFDRLRDKMVLAWGPKFAKDIQTIIPHLDHLLESFLKLSQSLHVIAGVGKIFEGWGHIFDAMAFVTNAVIDPKTRKELLDTTESVIKNGTPGFGLGINISNNFHGPTDASAVQKANDKTNHQILKHNQKAQNKATKTNQAVQQ